MEGENEDLVSNSDSEDMSSSESSTKGLLIDLEANDQNNQAANTPADKMPLPMIAVTGLAVGTGITCMPLALGLSVSILLYTWPLWLGMLGAAGGYRVYKETCGKEKSPPTCTIL